MGYQDEMNEELAELAARDEREANAFQSGLLALEVIRAARTDDDARFYREWAWAVVTEALTELRGHPVRVVALASRCSGVRTKVRYKAERA